MNTPTPRYASKSFTSGRKQTQFPPILIFSLILIALVAIALLFTSTKSGAAADANLGVYRMTIGGDCSADRATGDLYQHFDPYCLTTEGKPAARLVRGYKGEPVTVAAGDPIEIVEIVETPEIVDEPVVEPIVDQPADEPVVEPIVDEPVIDEPIVDSGDQEIKGNNGHGNNGDRIDISNPGHGPKNAEGVDPSAPVDDENKNKNK
jgi:hypothetical protein